MADRQDQQETPAGSDGQALAAIRGERDALRALWIEHRRWVAAILLAHKPKWVDVEDLLQDVAASFVRKVSEVRDPGAIKPWLRTVAINAARAAARERMPRKLGVQGSGAVLARVGDTVAAEGAAVSGVDEGRRLLELAQQLPEGYREPLLLRCLKDMSYREIGRLMDLPETTVETRIARGRRMLRELATGASVGSIVEQKAAHQKTLALVL